jgi:hypothetical protein
MIRNTALLFLFSFCALISSKYQVIETVDGFEINLNSNQFVDTNIYSELFFVASKNVTPILISGNIKLSLKYKENFFDVYSLKSSDLNISRFAKIKFTSLVPLSEKEFIPKYSLFINQSHLSGILNSQTKIYNKSNSIQSDLDTIRKFAKISTRYNQIYRVPLEGINKYVETESQINDLFLMNNGKDYPYYIEEINGVKSVIFVGKEARGDSTYFDNYDFYEHFYFYRKNGKNLYKLNKIDNIQPINNLLNSLVDTKHFEIEKEYEIVDVINIETVNGEGWYEKVITNSSVENRYDRYFNYNPVKDEQVELEINVACTNVAGIERFLYSKHSIYLNGKKLIDSTFTKKEVRKYIFKVNSSEFINGRNCITVVSDRLKLNQNTDTTYAVFSFDNLKIRSKSLNYALKNTFRYKNNGEEKNIIVEGFTKDSIYFIDNLNKTITNLNTNKRIILSGLSSNNYLSSNIGDSSAVRVTLNNEDKGYSLCIITETNNFFMYQTKDPAAVLHILNSLRTPKLVLTANVQIPDFLKNKLESDQIGAQQVNKGNNYVLIKNENKLTENYSDNQIIVTDTIEDYSYFVKANIKESSENTIGYIHTNDYTIDGILNDDIDNTTNYDMILITNKKFINSANNYKNYRATKGFNIKIVETENIYKDYSNGRITPHAIKDYLKIVNNKNPKLNYVMLWGDASFDSRNIYNLNFSTNYVPVFGLPVSDSWYTLFNIANGSTLKSFIISRVTLNEDFEGTNYVKKLIEQESTPKDKWHKTFLNITGGYSLTENLQFFNATYSYTRNLEDQKLCINVNDFNKTFDGVSRVGTDIRRSINEGAFWTTFLGHGSTSVFDTDGWYVESLNNKGKYGVLATLSCNASAFAEAGMRYSQNERYLLEPNKGFINVIGSTATGSVFQETSVFERSMNGMIDEKLRRIGDIFNYGTSGRSINEWPLYHHVLMGCPLVRIPIDTVPDYYFRNINIRNEKNDETINELDSLLIVKFDVENLGTLEEQTLEIIRKYKYNDSTYTKIFILQPSCSNQSILDSINIIDKAGIYDYTLQIDGGNFTSEINKSNNLIQLSIEVLTNSLLPIDPLDNWDVNPNDVSFRFIDPKNNSAKYRFEIYQDEILIQTSNDDEIVIKENYLEWVPVNTNVFELNKKYLLKAYKTTDLSTNVTKIRFWLNNSFIQNRALSKVKIDSNIIDFNNSLNIKIIQNKVTIKEDTLDFSLLASTGADPAQKRYFKLDYFDRSNPEINFNVFDSEFQGGFTVVEFDSKDIKTNYKAINFSTHYRFPGDTSELAGLKFIKFLKNDIKKNKYYIIATSDFPIHEYIYTIPKSLDTLKSLLNMLGSFSINNIAENSSYLFIFKTTEKTEVIIDSLKQGSFFKLNSYFQLLPDSAVIKFKPTFNVDSLIYIKSNKYIKDKNKLSLLVDDNLLFEGNENLAKNLNIQNKPLNLTYTLYRENEITDTLYDFDLFARYISDFSVTPSSFVILKDTIERGFDNKLSLTLENISKRFTNDKLFYIQQNSINKLDSNKYNVNLERNQSFKLDSNIQTEFLPVRNVINFQIDNERDLYKVNNNKQLKFIVTEDTTKPFVELFADNDPISDRSNVAKRPVFRILLKDLNPIKSTDKENSILFRINRVIQRANNTDYYQVKLNENNSKAELVIIPNQDLDFGENILSVVGQDASGNNTDPVDIYVIVEQNGSFSFLSLYPNPAIEQFKIRGFLKAPDNKIKARVQFANLSGQIVKTKELEVEIGDNSLEFDTLDDWGRELNQGVYYFSIDFLTNYYIEPVKGKLIKN